MKLFAAHGIEIDCGKRPPRIVGILNLSPDSFSGDGVRDMRSRIEQILLAGADMIDIGAESTRPGAHAVPVLREIALLCPAVRFVREQCSLPISIDTRKAAAADAALSEGANIINDVSGLQYDPQMADIAAKHHAGLVISHCRGTPETMQNPENLKYDDVTEDIRHFFDERIAYVESHGVKREQILLDPGIGFSKTPEQNLELIRNAGFYHDTFHLPLFYGVSRKSFLGTLAGIENPADRDFATAGVLSYLTGLNVDFLRVHNVRGAHDAVTMYQFLCGKGEKKSC